MRSVKAQNVVSGLFFLGLLTAAGMAGKGVSMPADESPESGAPPRAAALEFYPKKARAAGIEGTATLSCGVTARHALRACVVLLEWPRGWGFGDAALSLSRAANDDTYIMPADATEPVTFVFDLHPPAILPNVVSPDRAYATLTFLKRPDINTLERLIAPTGLTRGRAVLDCTIGSGSRLNACAVVDETPPGSGFGKAALEFADGFVIRPLRFDGATAQGDVHALIPIAWGDHR